MKDSSTNQTKPSKKRGFSPTNTPCQATVTPKKLKSLKTDETQLETKEIIEIKLQEEPPTKGNEELLAAAPSVPKLVSKPDDTTPQWAQQLLSMMVNIRKEIDTVREDLLVLQSRIPMKLNVKQLESSNPRPEAMDIEQLPRTPPVSTGEDPIPEEASKTERPPHANYLDDCFIKRIGLSPSSRQTVNITTFDGVLVAKGYNQIVPTWQGYFVELEKKDLVMTKLKPNEFPANGEKSWLCPGIKVFSLTRPDNRRSPRAHRFALKTSQDFTGQCNPLRLDKYYIHAYQVRFLVDNHSRSLNSRVMASDLENMYPDQYHPRGKDIGTTSNIQEPHLSVKPTQQNTGPTIHRHIQPTPFVPLTNFPQPYHPQWTIPYEAHFQQPSIPNTALQPTSMPPTNYNQNLPLSRQSSNQVALMRQCTPPIRYSQAANPISQWHALPASNSRQERSTQQPHQQNSSNRQPNVQNAPVSA